MGRHRRRLLRPLAANQVKLVLKLLAQRSARSARRLVIVERVGLDLALVGDLAQQIGDILAGRTALVELFRHSVDHRGEARRPFWPVR